MFDQTTCPPLRATCESIERKNPEKFVEGVLMCCVRHAGSIVQLCCLQLARNSTITTCGSLQRAFFFFLNLIIFLMNFVDTHSVSSILLKRSYGQLASEIP